MNQLMERCEVNPTTSHGPPREVTWQGCTYRVTGALGHVRTVGHWWSGEPGRDTWTLQCEQATLEVCRFDDAEPLGEPSGWWLTGIEDWSGDG